MDPEFKCEAAALLFPVKNAVEVKNGDIRRDDIGFYSSGTYEITIDLNVGVDAELFLNNLASVALYPLRKEVVRSVKDENWASLSAVIVSNGPFYVKNFELITESKANPKSITLERNQYYRREPDAESSIKKYVTPYRICVHYVTAEEAYEKYKSGEYAFTSDIPLAERKKLVEEVTMLDNMFTYSYLFNTNSEFLSDAKARKALSIAIDRKAIQDIVVFAKAADSLISERVYETTKGTSFHKSVISTSGNLEEAKKLVSEAGIKGKPIKLLVADEAADIAVAEYCVGVWKKIGVDASYEVLTYYGYDYKEDVIKTNANGDKVIEKETIYEDICGDKLREAYNNGEFDVIAVNYNMLTTDAFAVLAQFAPKYSGGAYDFSSTETEWPLIPHTSGYNSEKYAALIDAAYKAKTPEEKAKKLHEAEKLLISEDCVVAPLYFGRTAYLVNDNIKKLDTNFAGHLVWTKVKDKNYVPGAEEEETPAA
jgi:ABC-type oligopeptide transport system substrate-binding subunit